jgi:hypothetical protein
VLVASGFDIYGTLHVVDADEEDSQADEEEEDDQYHEEAQ